MPTPKKNEAKQDYLKRCTGELVKAEGKSAEQAYAVCNRYWDNEKGQRASLSLSAPLELKAGNPAKNEKPGFLITAFTGKPIERFWGTMWIDVDGIETKEKIPILREHARDRVVGFSMKTWKDDNNLLVSGEFSEATPDASQVLKLAQEGYPWQASISVRPRKVKVLDSDKETAKVNGEEVNGPGEIWMKSQVGEVSFVSLGADDNTAAIVMSEGDPVSVEIEQTNTQFHYQKEDEAMTLDEMKTQYAELYQEILDQGKAEVKLEEATTKARDEGVEAERKRVTDILDADADREATLKAIKDGVSADGSFKLFYEAEKTKRAKGLEDLEADAPESVGTETPKEAQKEDKRPADVILAEKAVELAQKEGINLAEAQMKVIDENPDLAKDMFPGQTA